jgi:hypothetical protein
MSDDATVAGEIAWHAFQRTGRRRTHEAPAEELCRRLAGAVPQEHKVTGECLHALLLLAPPFSCRQAVVIETPVGSVTATFAGSAADLPSQRCPGRPARARAVMFDSAASSGELSGLGVGLQPRWLMTWRLARRLEIGRTRLDMYLGRAFDAYGDADLHKVFLRVGAGPELVFVVVDRRKEG